MYHHPNRFDDHRRCDMGDLIILICHVTLRDHVFKGSCDTMEKNTSR